jgi:hypothetical protein
MSTNQTTALDALSNFAQALNLETGAEVTIPTELSGAQKEGAKLVRENPAYLVAFYLKTLGVPDDSAVTVTNSLIGMSPQGLLAFGRALAGHNKLLRSGALQKIKTVPACLSMVAINVAHEGSTEGTIIYTGGKSLSEIVKDKAATKIEVTNDTGSLVPTAITGDVEVAIVGDCFAYYNDEKPITRAYLAGRLDDVVVVAPYARAWALLPEKKGTERYTVDKLPDIRKHVRLGKYASPTGGLATAFSGNLVNAINQAMGTVPKDKTTKGKDVLAAELMCTINQTMAVSISKVLSDIEAGLIEERPKLDKWTPASAAKAFLEAYKAGLQPNAEAWDVRDGAQMARASVHAFGKRETTWTRTAARHWGLSVLEKQAIALEVYLALFSDRKEEKVMVVGASSKCHIKDYLADHKRLAKVIYVDKEVTQALSGHNARQADFFALKEADVEGYTYLLSDAKSAPVAPVKSGTSKALSDFDSTWPFARHAAALKIPAFSVKVYVPPTNKWTDYSKEYSALFSEYEVVAFTHGQCIHSGEIYLTFVRSDREKSPSVAFKELMMQLYPLTRWMIFANRVRNTYAALGMPVPAHMVEGALEQCFPRRPELRCFTIGKESPVTFHDAYENGDDSYTDVSVPELAEKAARAYLEIGGEEMRLEKISKGEDEY